MLVTGLHKLDEFLSGGIPNGVITDIFGSPGTGKTQFLFQLSYNAIKDGDKILYVDTSGSFRPERIIEIQTPNNLNLDVLDRITVLRITNTSEQTKSLQMINGGGFDAVLIDNVTDLFSYEYKSSEQTHEKNLQFMQYMRELSLHTITNKIPTVVTNSMRYVDLKEIENMSAAIDPFTHIKIGLSKSSTKFLGKAVWLHNCLDFSYKVCQTGLSDID